MKLLKRSTAVTALAVMSSTVTYAAPVIEGNTLSWPDDGWYQVQDAQSYASLCEGGRSCEVPAGSYIVINHTTGERFENIQVANGGNVDSPTVSGNVISWPDNGWYQVQRMGTYESVCQGGLSCEVSAGSYIVINHTNGVRYENVLVGDAGTDPGIDVPAPANLRMVVYSYDSGELMWDRAAPEANIREYEIIRNGAVVGTTDGISWFESQRVIGDQLWEVVAINRDGVRSESVFFPDTGAVSDLLKQAEQHVDDIQSAFNLQELNEATGFGWRMANTARQLSQGVDPVEFQVGQTDIVMTGMDLTGTQFNCDSGEFSAHVEGSFAEKPNGEPNGYCSAPEGSRCEINIIADACAMDGNKVVSGDFRFELNTGWAGTSSESVYLDDYQMTSQAESGQTITTISSGYLELYDSPDINISSAAWSSDELNIVAPDSTRTVVEQYLRATKEYGAEEFENFTSWAYIPDTLFGGLNLFVTLAPENNLPANGFAQIGTFTATSGLLNHRELIIGNSSDQPDTWDMEIRVNDTVERSIYNSAP